MSTQLGKQLSFLQNVFQQTSAPQLKHGKESFLFTPEKAARLTYEDVHVIGVDGLTELIRLDPRFKPYLDTLFHPSSIERNRELETKHENTILDNQIEGFFLLLSPYFLLNSAHKSIEYLIRRYKVHVYNVDSIMASIIAYHETPFFSRFVQLLNIQPTKWHFLEPMQNSGVVMSRTTFIQRCYTDFSILMFLCDAMKVYVERGIENKTFINFYIASLIEYISGKSLKEVELKRILAYVLFGLRSSEPDLVAGSLMVITQISSCVTLSYTVVESIIEVIIQIANSVNVESLLMCVSYLFQSQPISKIKSNLLKGLFELPNFVEAMNNLSKSYNIENYLNAILNSAIEYTFNEQNLDLLENIISSIDFSKHIPKVVAVLMNLYISDKSFSETIKKIFLLFERKYSTETDKGFELGLSTLEEEDHSTALEFYSTTFRDSKHEILPEVDTTVYLALQHSEKSVRMLGLKHLAKVSVGAENEETKNFISESLRERLSDEDPNVLEFVLSFPNVLKYVDIEQIVDKITHIVKRIEENKGDETAKKLSVTIAEKLLTQEVFDNPKCNIEKLLTFVTRFLLLSEDFKETNLKVISSLQKVKYPLFKNLSSVLINDNTNQQIIKVIGKNLAQNPQLVEICEHTAVKEGVGSKAILLLLSSAMHESNSEENKLLIATSILNLVKRFVSKQGIVIGIKDLYHPKQQANITHSINYLMFYSAYSLLECLSIQKLSANEVLNYLLNGATKHTYSTLLTEFFITISESKLFDQFTEHVKILIENHLKKDTLILFSSLWGSENVPYKTKIRSLLIGFFFLDEETNYQQLLPSLLVALRNNSSRDMVSAVISCIKRISGTGSFSHPLYTYLKPVSSNDIEKVKELIVNNRVDLATDNSYLSQLVNSFPDSVVKMLLDVIQNTKSDFERYSLLSIVSSLPSVRVLPSTFDVLTGLLKLVETNENISRLKLLSLNTLLHFLDLDVLTKDEKYFTQGLLKAITLHKTIKTIESTNLSITPCNLVANCVSSSLIKELDESQRRELLETILRVLKKADISVAQVYKKVLKHLPVNVETLLSLLPESISTDAMDTAEEGRDAFEEMSFVLEITQLMKNTHGRENLAPRLVSLLKQLKELYNTSKTKVEYSMSMILSVLYAIASRISKLEIKQKQDRKEKLISSIQNNFDIQLIISCLLECESSSIRNHAILLIGELAFIFPSQIIEHILGVMKAVEGSLRDKESNNFDAIQKTIIEITPRLVEQNVDMKYIINIFVKSMKYIPKEKRLPFFASLVKGVSRKNIYGFVFLMISFVVTGGEADDSNVITSFCHELVEYFKVDKQLLAIVNLMGIVNTIFNEVSGSKDKTDGDKFYVSTDYSDSEKEALITNILEFVFEHLESIEFLKMLITHEERNYKNTQKYLLSVALDINLLRDKTPETDSSTIELLDGIHSKIQQLLKSATFVALIKNLLNNTSTSVRERAFIILNTRLADESTQLVTQLMEDQADYISILKKLRSLLSEGQTNLLTQAAIISVEFMARRFASEYKSKFAKVVPVVLKHFKESTSSPVVSSSALCLATLSSEIGRESSNLNEIVDKLIGHLNSFLSKGQDIEEDEKDANEESRTTQILVYSCLCALELLTKVHLGEMGSFLKQIMNILLSTRILLSNNRKISQKSSAVLYYLAVNAKPELILEPVFASLEECVKFGYDSIVKLVDVLHEIILVMDTKSMEKFSSKILNFLLEVVDLRRQQKFDRKIIENIEKNVCNAFESFVLKLNEELLRPALRQIIEWSRKSFDDSINDYLDYGDKKQAPPNVYRLIVFYKLMTSAAQKLSFLFISYFGYFWDNMIKDIEAITRDPNAEDDEPIPEVEDDSTSKKRKIGELTKKKKSKFVKIENSEDRIQLAAVILQTLEVCFSNDKENFVGSNERFEILLGPLSSLLDVEEVCAKNYNRISRAFGLLATVVEQNQWKPLQFQMLQRLHNDSSIAKRAAIACIASFYENVGKEFIIVLPEMMPHIAEILETDDEELLRDARALVLTIEKATGEEISQYLNE
ncbi:hypothetical protein ABK040_015653 [Willaertia magna]